MNTVTKISSPPLRAQLLEATYLSQPIQVRIMLAGFGPHAERTYLQHIAELCATGRDVRLCVLVELDAAREAVLARLEKYSEKQPDATAFISPVCADALDARTEFVLNRLAEQHRINAVIVATPPEAHFAYADWALRRGFSVLLDKPVSSRVDAVSSLRAARGIRHDVVDLVKRYGEARRKGRVAVLVNAQRRWHPAFRYVRQKVEEVRRLTGHPISHIAAAHGDGQFRLPAEWLDIGYHGYRHGNGKVSHSGYHEIDMILYLLAAGWTARTKPTHLQVHSSFVQPSALLQHMPRDRYVEMFGDEYNAYAPYTDAELAQVAHRLGEVDAFITIELMQHHERQGVARIDLQHNTVSARSWLQPGGNLYKENGRLKREFWRIDSGPFQSIRIETIQAEDKHDVPGTKGSSIGQCNHLQIVTVRDEKLLGSGRRVEVVDASELGEFDRTRLQSEQVKMAALKEFVDFVEGRIDREDLTSDLSDHMLSASVMSAAYESHVRRSRRGSCGWVKVKVKVKVKV
ncbi:Gfo/Idh/MocA family protein [Falsiroseomonas sp. E2-1-a20]|uniref:Gfo/Idh/MocA family protein n=1 Tax=Falsiroseomonas sp. E2-1-a20 TaxID=3239300 RepID=UPI003F40E027